MGTRARTEQFSITNTLATLASHSGGLLTDETRALLEAGKFDEVATNSATALMTGFLAPLVSVKQDPYLLATDYLMQLQHHVESRVARGWSPRDGDLVCERDGRCYRLLVFDGFKTSDSAFICDLLERVRAGRSGVPPLQTDSAGRSGASFCENVCEWGAVSRSAFHGAYETRYHRAFGHFARVRFRVGRMAVSVGPVRRAAPRDACERVSRGGGGGVCRVRETACVYVCLWYVAHWLGRGLRLPRLCGGGQARGEASAFLRAPHDARVFRAARVFLRCRTAADGAFHVCGTRHGMGDGESVAVGHSVPWEKRRLAASNRSP